MNGDIGLAWELLQPLIIMGVTIGVVLAILFGFIRIGLKLAPWIVVAALAVWFFGGV